MYSMNKVILAGRVSADVDFRQAKSMSIASFRMGVYAGKDKDGKPSYNNFTVKVFKELADKVMENISKGTDVVVTGTWKTGSYKNQKGDTVYTNEVLADNVAVAL